MQRFAVGDFVFKASAVPLPDGAPAADVRTWQAKEWHGGVVQDVEGHASRVTLTVKSNGVRTTTKEEEGRVMHDEENGFVSRRVVVVRSPSDPANAPSFTKKKKIGLAVSDPNLYAAAMAWARTFAFFEKHLKNGA